ncbi:TadE family protein [Sediminimonas sp.]|uniref:TadE/TadG family type IV pilus assembly protein n=1 Tax=Sediminimonas sp. TaxID=2823379 RepID=UPI0025CEF7DF|nr:TadE family protein [Sediminimonas sp.]
MTRKVASLVRSLKGDQGGSIAVEFALVAPVLLFIFAGVIDIGSAAYARLSLDARLTAAAEYALFQPAPANQEAADALAENLVGLLRDGASDTAEVIVNNAASAQWDGATVTTASRPGDAGMCYCPTLAQGGLAWGAPVECGTTCATGESAGKFVEISATARLVTLFRGYAFIDGETVESRTVLRVQ